MNSRQSLHRTSFLARHRASSPAPSRWSGFDTAGRGKRVGLGRNLGDRRQALGRRPRWFRGVSLVVQVNPATGPCLTPVLGTRVARCCGRHCAADLSSCAVRRHGNNGHSQQPRRTSESFEHVSVEATPLCATRLCPDVRWRIAIGSKMQPGRLKATLPAPLMGSRRARLTLTHG